MEKIKKYISKFIKTSKEYIKNAKKKLKKYAKTNIMVIVFIVTNLINGILLRGLTVGNQLAIKPVLADITVLLFVSAFVYFIKPKKQIIYLFTWSIIFTATCLINAIYYSNYISFASFSLLSALMELTGYADAVTNLLEFKFFVYLWQPFALLFVHYQLKFRDYYKKVTIIEKAKNRCLNTLIVALITLGFFISQLTSVDISRLNKQWNRTSVVMEFGIYIYQMNDLVTSVKTKVNTMFGYDEASKTFREYYDNKKSEQEKNKYSELFKGKNVIVIHGESLQGFTMNLKFNGKELTPNLNKMAKEGMYFSNFYSEESVGNSSDSEFTLASSLMPSSSGTVFMNYFDREYVTLQKLLKEQGYYTFSMHGNNGSSWNRNVMHPSLGYDKFYSSKDYNMDEIIGLGLSDKSFFKQSVEKIKKISKKHDKFYGSLIMLTNHTPFDGMVDDKSYSVNLDIDCQKAQEIEKEQETNPENTTKIIHNEDGTCSIQYLEGTKMGNYLKTVHYADEAIGELFEELKEADLLDDTVVVLYGDHDAKLKQAEFERLYYNDYINDISIDKDKILSEVNDYTYELNRKVPFIIWSKDKIDTNYNKEVKKPMGMIDVMPTLGNMFDVYNPYALGHDIFSIDDNVVVFPDGNWLNERMYYNSSKEEYLQLTDDAVSMDEIKKNSKHAEELINVSNGIITYDLIKRIEETNKVLESVKK